MALASVREFQAKELDYVSYNGEPLYLATNGRGETRIIPVSGEPIQGFDADELMRRVREQAGGRLAELSLMHEYDAYYLDRLGRAAAAGDLCPRERCCGNPLLHRPEDRQHRR